MKAFFVCLFRSLWGFIKSWSEVVTIPVGLLLWWLSPNILRWLDPEAGLYDAGVFQNPLFAIIQLLIFSGIIRIVMKLSWSVLDDYLDNHFANTFNSLTSWQKLKLSVCVFLALLYTLAMLSSGI